MADNIRMISLPECEGTVLLNVDGGISVRIDLLLAEDMADTDVVKVYASSPHLPDMYLGMADVAGRRCTFSAHTDSVGDYDGVKLIRKNAFTDSSALFAHITFADTTVSQLEYLKSHSAYREYLTLASTIKSPASRAEEALDSFRRLHPNIEGEREKCIERLKSVISSCSKAPFSLAESFEWYMAEYFSVFAISSATEHILSPLRVGDVVAGNYILAVGVDWLTHTLCIAIPVDNPSVNPLPHIDDCTVFIKSPQDDTCFCTVGVNFAPDGQYFVRIDE